MHASSVWAIWPSLSEIWKVCVFECVCVYVCVCVLWVFSGGVIGWWKLVVVPTWVCAIWNWFCKVQPKLKRLCAHWELQEWGENNGQEKHWWIDRRRVNSKYLIKRTTFVRCFCVLKWVCRQDLYFIFQFNTLPSFWHVIRLTNASLREGKQSRRCWVKFKGTVHS